MSAPPRVRPPTARRSPVDVRAHRRRRSASPWWVGACFLAAAGAGAGLWWRHARGVSPGPAAADAPVVAAPVTVDSAGALAPSAVPAPSGPSAEQIDAAVAEGAVLTREAAEALLGEAARRGESAEHPLDSALYVASLGFGDMDRATLDELGELMTRSWKTRPAGDQGLIHAYMRHARQGEPLSPDAIDAGRALFVAGVRGLPAASQARIKTLFAKAVAAGIGQRARAEDRTRVAALTPLPPPEGPPSPAPRPVTPSSPTPAPGYSSGPVGSAAGATGEEYGGGRQSASGGGESYWRSRAQAARAAVAAAESRVRALEAEAARLGPVRPGALPQACQEVTSRRAGEWETKTRLVCDEDTQRALRTQQMATQVEEARAQLRQAQQRLEDLEEEARRAGALPGWLR